jgi:glycosyltransferase involved in cell wall biosynthesis
MRVLVANKFWYRRGGLERVMFDEIAWLEGAGHEVAHFSTAHPENQASQWADFFVPYLELGTGGGLTLEKKASAALRMFTSREAARRFDALCVAFKPDVIHLHGIHRQISPSIVNAARRRHVPVVQTLHDYHHICPADVLLYRGCELCDPRRCRTIWYGAAVSGRCVRGGWAASALSAGETSFQRLRGVYERGVSRFISPSQFMAERMADGGWSVPTDVVPNAVQVERERASERAGFCIIGRLSREKGVGDALEAAATAGVRVTVAGEGPLESALRSAHPEALFVGRLGAAAVADLVRRSTAVIVPSVWFENAPMSVLEAMAAGTPVIASAIGGIPEQVTDGVDGLLVPAGDVGALAEAMRRIQNDHWYANRLGVVARATVAGRFSPERHLAGVLDSYQAAGVPA